MRRLPPQPSLEHLRKEAKELLRRLRRGELEDPILRWLPAAPPADDLAVPRWTLQEVQHALAVDYGFSSWAALKAYIAAASGHSPLGDIPAVVMAQWQQIVDTLSQLLEVPTALIRRVDGDEIETLVAASAPDTTDGLAALGQRAPLAGQHCERVVRERAPLRIVDTRGGDASASAPALERVSYLGYPVLLPWGEVFGTLCVLDRQPRSHSPKDETVLAQLARLIEAQLALLHQGNLLTWRSAQVQTLLEAHRLMCSLVRICSFCRQVAHDESWVPIEEFMGHNGLAFTHGICPTCFATHCSEGDDDVMPG